MLERLRAKIAKRIEKHGEHSHFTRHDSVAICDEEINEVKSAVHLRQEDCVLIDGYLDLACAAVWAAISVGKYQGTK
jgi:hypothetical protein